MQVFDQLYWFMLHVELCCWLPGRISIWNCNSCVWFALCGAGSKADAFGSIADSGFLDMWEWGHACSNTDAHRSFPCPWGRRSHHLADSSIVWVQWKWSCILHFPCVCFCVNITWDQNTTKSPSLCVTCFWEPSRSPFAEAFSPRGMHAFLLCWSLGCGPGVFFPVLMMRSSQIWN